MPPPRNLMECPLLVTYTRDRILVHPRRRTTATWMGLRRADVTSGQCVNAWGTCTVSWIKADDGAEYIGGIIRCFGCWKEISDAMLPPARTFLQRRWIISCSPSLPNCSVECMIGGNWAAIGARMSSAHWFTCEGCRERHVAEGRVMAYKWQLVCECIGRDVGGRVARAMIQL
jgi:hypothetical protein